MDPQLLSLIKEHGLTVVTLALVLLSFFKDEVKAFFQKRLSRLEEKHKKEDDLNRKAWTRVFQNGPRADSLYERLLLQQENNAAATRERDEHIERFTAAAVTAMRDAAEVMQRVVTRFETSEDLRAAQWAIITGVLDTIGERMAGIGLILSLYLHDKQGVTFDELIQSIKAQTEEEKHGSDTEQ
jgi:hypothetical protein